MRRKKTKHHTREEAYSLFVQRYQRQSLINYTPSGTYIARCDNTNIRYAGPCYDHEELRRGQTLSGEKVVPVEVTVFSEQCDEFDEDGYYGMLRYRDGAIVGIYKGYKKSSSYWSNKVQLESTGFGCIVEVKIVYV